MHLRQQRDGKEAAPAENATAACERVRDWPGTRRVSIVLEANGGPMSSAARTRHAPALCIAYWLRCDAVGGPAMGTAVHTRQLPYTRR